MFKLKWLLVVIAIALVANVAQAAITITGSDSTRSASATFDIVGGNLVVTLANTQSLPSSTKFVQTDVLAALFFDISGNPTLSKISANVDTSKILLNGTDITATETTSGDVGPEWAYKSGALPGVTQQYGISAVGFSIFGPPDTFEPGNLPHSQGNGPDGIDYGLMPLGTTNFTHANFSTIPFIQNSVTITLNTLPVDFSLESISNVRFQYGTDLEEPHFNGEPIPEAASMVIWAILAGVVGIAIHSKRRLALAGTQK